MMDEAANETEAASISRDEAAVAFATALVSLARQHGANRLELDFDMTGHTADWRVRDKWDHGSIHLSWSNGRHGSADRIALRYQSTVSLLETPSNTRSTP